MSKTLLEVLQEVIDRHPALGRRDTVTGATDTQNFQAAKFAGATAADLVQPGAPVYVSDTTDDLAPIGESSYVDEAPVKASTVVDIYPALTTALEASDTIQVWHQNLQHIDNVKKCVERALAEITHRWVLVPLTILLDGDMEKPTYADWTAGGVASQAKTASTEGYPTRQYNHLVNTSITGDIYQDVQAEPDETFSLAVLCRGGTTVTEQARVRVMDGAAETEIALSGDDNEAEVGMTWQVLRYTFTISSAATAARIRLGGANVGDDVDFAWAALTRQDAREVVLPDRVRDVGKVGRVFKAVRRVSTPYEPPGSWRLDEIDGIEKLATRGTGGVVLRFPGTMGDGLYFYEEWQGYEALSADSDTTEAPFDLLVEASALNCYELAYQTWNAGHERRIPQAGAPVRDPNPWLYHLRRQAPKVKALSRTAVGDAVTVVRR